MPAAGQACLVEDLNMRGQPVDEIVAEYSDIEGKHRIVVLDGSDNVLLFIDTLSHLGPKEDQSLGTKSYCEPKKAGEAISLKITHASASTDWWMVMN